MQEEYFTKQDWMLFRSKSIEWQDEYMEKLCREYTELLSQDAKASEKFWTLVNRIKLDKRSPGVMLEMRKSLLIQNIIALIYDEVINVEDLADFSNKLQERVKSLLEFYTY